MNNPKFRQECAQWLREGASRASSFKAFIGLDGFVDEIVYAVDKRQNAKSFSRLPTIQSFAERVAGAAGKSTNVELVTKKTKLGGNGPIMANALINLGLKVTYLGALGDPTLHFVFKDFAARAEVFSIAEPGRTDAIEFEDGKLMFGKQQSLAEVTWENIQERFGRERFVQNFESADLVGFVNWTMIPFMTDIWESILAEVCPGLGGKRRTIFFDLADPEKRPAEDIVRAMQTIANFQKYFKVILGLNEKEALEVSAVMGIRGDGSSANGLARMVAELQNKLAVETVVVHPVSYALAASGGQVDRVEGPVISTPVITTGAGDHFNSGFCLGKLLGYSNAQSVLCGVTASGFYVQTGQSPTMLDLAAMMENWPE